MTIICRPNFTLQPYSTRRAREGAIQFSTEGRSFSTEDSGKRENAFGAEAHGCALGGGKAGKTGGRLGEKRFTAEDQHASWPGSRNGWRRGISLSGPMHGPNWTRESKRTLC